MSRKSEEGRFLARMQQVQRHLDAQDYRGALAALGFDGHADVIDIASVEPKSLELYQKAVSLEQRYSTLYAPEFAR